VKKLLLLLLVLSASTSAKEATISKPEADEGWVLLFDGTSMTGLTATPPSAWRVDDGVLAATADGATVRSNSAFADFSIALDYRADGAGADCALVVRSTADNPRDSGYLVQLGDTRPDWPAGSIVEQAKAPALPPSGDRWHALEATAVSDRISVTLEKFSVAEAKNVRSQAGFVGLSCRQGRMQFRNIKLKPLEMKALFNGTDLSGWKVVGAPPKNAGIVKKMFFVGGKPKDAKWSVAAARTIHVEDGTGQLETATTYDDFVLHLAMRVKAKDRNDRPKSAVFVRGDAGQLFTGYEVQDGALLTPPSARPGTTTTNEFFTETIAVRGRHIQTWVDGVPVSDVQDTRAEGTSAQKDARTAAGTISLQAFDDRSNLDFRNLRVSALPKTLGKVAAPVVTAAPPPLGATATPAGSAPPVIQTAPPIDPNRPKVQELMKKALATNDPDQQVQIYSDILLLDPNNQVAFTGRQQAQQKVDEARAKQAKDADAKAHEAQTAVENKQNGEAKLKEAEESLLARDFSRAQAALSVAERLLPGDSRLSALRTRIDQATNARERLNYALTGAGAVALMGGIVLFVRGRGPKVPYLEVVKGIDKGKRFVLDQEIMHIGAIAQDGGEKNEIVVRDMENMISRFHCEVHTRGKHVYVIDLGSANRTKVDKKAIKAGKAVLVKKGGRIDLAGTCILKLGSQRRTSA
jgi:pSer/pThr/pTyr-binding forkhead associated (FHA) protein